MKLLVVLSVSETTKDVKRILINHKVPVYSEVDMEGFRVKPPLADKTNWFAQGKYGVFSKLFFTFCEENNVSDVLKAITDFNQQHEDSKQYPLHAFQLNVEKTA